MKSIDFERDNPDVQVITTGVLYRQNGGYSQLENSLIEAMGSQLYRFFQKPLTTNPSKVLPLG